MGVGVGWALYWGAGVWGSGCGEEGSVVGWKKLVEVAFISWWKRWLGKLVGRGIERLGLRNGGNDEMKTNVARFSAEPHTWV